MNNKYQAPYPQTIIEKRAPTDDSIRIYQELLEKCRTEIVSLGSPANSLLKGALYRLPNMSCLRDEFRFYFELNGSPISISIDISEMESIMVRMDGKGSVAELVYDKMSKSIGEAILNKSGFFNLFFGSK